MNNIFHSTLNTRLLSGGTLQPFQYIRSDVPNQITKEEVQWLVKNNILTIVDLRTKKEVEYNPCPLSQYNNFIYLHMPVTGGNIVPDTTDEVPISYLKMVDNEMTIIIKTIESAKTGVLFFCNAGKDRTGVVSALLLLRAGANRNEIVKDYLISKENLKKVLFDYSINNKKVNIEVITPRSDYMERFLDQVNYIF